MAAPSLARFTKTKQITTISNRSEGIVKCSASPKQNIACNDVILDCNAWSSFVVKAAKARSNFKTLNIQPTNTTITLSLTKPQEIGSGCQETSVLLQEKLKRKPWARWKDEEIPHAAQMWHWKSEGCNCQDSRGCFYSNLKQLQGSALRDIQIPLGRFKNDQVHRSSSQQVVSEEIAKTSR